MSTFAVTNPNTGRTEETFDSVTEEQIPALIDAADQAYQSWKATPVEKRAAVLSAAAELFDSRAEELAAIIGSEMGKPHKQGVTEVKKVAFTFRWFAENGPGYLEPTKLPEAEGAEETYVKHDPIGVLLGIMPWNFPYNQIARFAVPNLLVGNAVMMKQAAICPRSSQAFQDILEEAGLPEGVYTNLYLNSSDAEKVLQDFRVKGVSLTGSEAAGASVASLAAKYLKKSVLELGGNDPAVVLDTDDIDELAKTLVTLRTANAGQVCTSPKRLIVVEDLYEDFVAAAKSAVEAVKVGPADDPDTDMGPLSSEDARDEVVERIEQAVKDGATLHTGGQKLDRDGWFMSPALLTDIDLDSDLGRNELFGPAVMVFKAKDEDDALRIANSTQYGLMASVWTQDRERGRNFAEQIEAGMTFVNTHMDSSPEFPFGGVNNSGYGRENAEWALREFTNERLVRIAKHPTES
ncbi:NAD-dependent succinate-semialdehyde dehydrogenase [Nesterenkonia massiliensis]|uniref:NAD-dependent succinate-semialdehyde dehydrogenase n=2 Tax=Nesterenkonia massiliensis TaxID=1232429 RepID=A0ABT2HQT4_9MICC|nr:NAD-dependent succinate-semialdehyde dehydrogenase [Nesterenkonia massiliensis]MCT1607022.1 NAD-dependent succinate-semialdehyde dehydrogenase [Nesterenkonia massiliensis]